jgi:hypothetical protein
MAKRRAGSQIGNLIPTTKSQESPQFPCVQVVCDIPLESSQQGLQLCFRPHLNQRYAHNIMGPQSRGNLGTKWHLSASLMVRHKIYYKRKVVASPKSGPWWVLWIRVCPWFVRAPECSNYALTYLLFGLCRSVKVIEVLVNLPSLIPEL